MNAVCLVGAIILFALTAYCISEKYLILAFLLAIGACETLFHAAGMVGDHFTKEQIEIIKRDAVEEYKKEHHP